MITLKDLIKLIKDFDGEDDEYLNNDESLVLHDDKGNEFSLTYQLKLNQ